MKLDCLDVETATVNVFKAYRYICIIILQNLFLIILFKFDLRLASSRFRLSIRWRRYRCKWLVHGLWLCSCSLFSNFDFEFSLFLWHGWISYMLPCFNDQNLNIIYEDNLGENLDTDSFKMATYLIIDICRIRLLILFLLFL